MKILLIGASGNIGRRIMAEATSRGHAVTAVARDQSKIEGNGGDVAIVSADVLKRHDMKTLVCDHDVVINAAAPSENVNDVSAAANVLIGVLHETPDTRLIVVGGAGSLEVEGGKQLVETPEFPDEWKSLAKAHREALNRYRRSTIEWTYLSPPADIRPGTRTGKYREGKDRLLIDETGKSTISIEDFAVAVLDEVEHPHHIQERFTVAY